MSIFAVPDSLDAKYKGDGYAFAASSCGHLVDLRYLRDIVGEVPKTEQEIATLIEGQQTADVIRELNAVGLVHFGLCGGREFTELQQIPNP